MRKKDCDNDDDIINPPSISSTAGSMIRVNLGKVKGVKDDSKADKKRTRNNK